MSRKNRENNRCLQYKQRKKMCDCQGSWRSYWDERRYNEDETNDNRTAAQRDYARVIHSSAFRRLQRKTQVFGLGHSDFYRTRLTHSLEVCQIGEGITRNLRQKLVDCRVLPESARIRAICLAHDLGHPPFGHGGEQALNKIMLEHGGFEGNGQSLRVMASIPSYHENYGMNLSRRTLLGVIKYPAPYSETENIDVYPAEDSKKPTISKFKPPKCYFDDEHETINWIKGKIPEDWNFFNKVKKDNKKEHYKTIYKSLDASILEIADDIAYGVHDLEDAIALRFVKRSDFEKVVQRKNLDRCNSENEELEYVHLLDLLFSEKSTERKRAIGRLVSCFVGSVYFKRSNSINFTHPVFFSQAYMPYVHRNLLKKFKKIVYDNVIATTKVQQLEHKGRMIIGKLFSAFDDDPENLLPADQYIRYRKGKDDREKKRVICDYIAGMTDDYAIRRYQQMFIPNVGSVFDHLG